MSRPVEWYPARIEQLAKDLKAFTDKRLAQKRYPVVEGFLADEGISTEHFYNLTKEHPVLLEALEYQKAKAKDCLIDGAMRDQFNAGFSKFVAINCHGMRDGLNVEHSGSVEHNVFLDNVIKRSAEDEA